MPVIVTYDDGNRLEDVMMAVIQLSPTDTPFTSGIGKTRAINTFHQWPEDTLAARGDNAVIEGQLIQYGTVTAPVRLANFTQIYSKEYDVSSTERWVNGAGVDDMFIYQQQKALMELSNDIEHGYLQGTRASGTGSAARRMSGAIEAVTTNSTTVASGTKLTESFFNGMAENCYTQGGRPDEIYVGSRLKRIITSFTAGSTKNIASDDKRLVNSVDVYESDFGIMKIFLARDMPNSTSDSLNDILMIENRKFKMSIGEPVNVLGPNDVAQDKHGNKGLARFEGTLETLGERHNALSQNLSNNYPA